MKFQGINLVASSRSPQLTQLTLGDFLFATLEHYMTLQSQRAGRIREILMNFFNIFRSGFLHFRDKYVWYDSSFQEQFM